MTFLPGENQLAGSSDPIIANQILAIANYEYSYQLPTNTRKFQLKPRQNDREVKLSFNAGESGTTYITIPPGGYWHDLVGMPYQMIYFQTETEGTILEIEAWS